MIAVIITLSIFSAGSVFLNWRLMKLIRQSIKHADESLTIAEKIKKQMQFIVKDRERFLGTMAAGRIGQKGIVNIGQADGTMMVFEIMKIEEKKVPLKQIPVA